MRRKKEHYGLARNNSAQMFEDARMLFCPTIVPLQDCFIGIKTTARQVLTQAGSGWFRFQHVQARREISM